MLRDGSMNKRSPGWQVEHQSIGQQFNAQPPFAPEVAQNIANETGNEARYSGEKRGDPP